MASDSVPDKDELRKKLAPLAYSVTQEKGTERAWTSEFNTLKAKGTFKCVCWYVGALLTLLHTSIPAVARLQ
jgi:peptide methionine sulfoxide reductase MsrB